VTEFVRPRCSVKLGELPLTARALEGLAERGVLEARFRREDRASQLEALDGSGARLWLGTSGQVIGLTMTELDSEETSCEIAFDIGTVTVAWCDDVLRFYLRTEP
jgi:hypothetical protein